MKLIAKTCTPCSGGVPPLSNTEAQNLLLDVADWHLTHKGERIMRRFDWPDFKSALDFVNTVGDIAEQQGHHPDISFGWGYCTVELYTHKIKGLHENDFILAARIDAAAKNS